MTRGQIESLPKSNRWTSPDGFRYAYVDNVWTREDVLLAGEHDWLYGKKPQADALLDGALRQTPPEPAGKGYTPDRFTAADLDSVLKEDWR